MREYIGSQYRTTLVCVDRYQERVMEGRLYNPGLSRGRAFRGLMDLFLCMEGLLDEMKQPQGFVTMRSFREGPAAQGGLALTGDQEQVGRQATFAVRVLFRQGASWQGSVTWLEGRREENFRSALELALLLDSALSEDPQRRSVPEDKTKSPPQDK